MPGWFGSFLFILYVIRYNYKIRTALELVNFLYVEWSSSIVVILSLGAFFGVVLIGLDGVIHSFIGSRVVEGIVKYLLSSRIFQITFMRFMRLRDTKKAFESLPSNLIREIPECRQKLIEIVDAEKRASKCFLREVLQNYFWYDLLDENRRLDMKQTRDMAAMFFYISSISLFFFFFQLFNYIAQVFYHERGLSIFVDYLPLLLLFYIMINFSVNISMSIRRRISERRNRKSEAEKKSLQEKSTEKSRTAEKTPWTRKITDFFDKIGIAYFILGIIMFTIYWRFISPIVLKGISWFDFADLILLGIFFILFSSAYYAGSFEFTRFFINYDRYFRANTHKITSYINKNSNRIRVIHDKVCGWKSKKIIFENHPIGKTFCNNCKAFSNLIFRCPDCGYQYCVVCRNSTETCHNCDSEVLI